MNRPAVSCYRVDRCRIQPSSPTCTINDLGRSPPSILTASEFLACLVTSHISLSRVPSISTSLTIFSSTISKIQFSNHNPFSFHEILSHLINRLMRAALYEKSHSGGTGRRKVSRTLSHIRISVLVF